MSAADIPQWPPGMDIDVDDLAPPLGGLDLGAELGFGPEEPGVPFELDASMDPLSGLGDSLGAELGADHNLSSADLDGGGTLGDELAGQEAEPPPPPPPPAAAAAAAAADEKGVKGEEERIPTAGASGLLHASRLLSSAAKLGPNVDATHAADKTLNDRRTPAGPSLVPGGSIAKASRRDAYPPSPPPPPAPSDTHDIEQAQAAFEARLQATHAQTLAQLNDTVQHTDAFLAHLRPPPLGQKGVEEDLQRLEAAATSVVRQLQDTAIQREAQVRELKEAQLVFDLFEPPPPPPARSGVQQPHNPTPGSSPPASVAAAATAAASLGPHWVPRSSSGTDMDAEDQLIEVSLLTSQGEGGTDLLGLHPSHKSGDNAAQGASGTRRAVLRDESLPSSPPLSEPSSHFALERGRVGAEMTAVHDTTADLLVGLAAMNEYTQVHRAAVNDLSRKFRGLRGALGQIVSESRGTQESINWLTQWHQRQLAEFSVHPTVTPTATAASSTTTTTTTNNNNNNNSKNPAGTRAFSSSPSASSSSPSSTPRSPSSPHCSLEDEHMPDPDRRADPRAAMHAGLVAWMQAMQMYMSQALAEAEAQAHRLLQPPLPPPSIAKIDLSSVPLPVSVPSASVVGQA